MKCIKLRLLGKKGAKRFKALQGSVSAIDSLKLQPLAEFMKKISEDPKKIPEKLAKIRKKFTSSRLCEDFLNIFTSSLAEPIKPSDSVINSLGKILDSRLIYISFVVFLQDSRTPKQ